MFRRGVNFPIECMNQVDAKFAFVLPLNYHPIVYYSYYYSFIHLISFLSLSLSLFQLLPQLPPSLAPEGQLLHHSV